MSELTQFGQHPDADQLTAFVEHALPSHEREQTLAHLAACEHCRAIVALGLPPLEEFPAPQPEPVRKPWFMGWHLAWPAGAALAALSFVIIHLHNTTPIKSVVPAPTEIATSQPAAALSVSPAPTASPRVAEPQSPNQTATASAKALSDDVKLRDQSMAGPPIANRSYTPLTPPEAAPMAGASNGQRAMNITVAPTLPQSQTAGPATPPQPNAVIAANALAAAAMAAPAPVAASNAGVAATSPQAAAGAAINFDSNASPTTPIAINGIYTAPSPTSPPAALPSRLPALSTVVNGHKVLAIDTQNTLFYSEDEGKHWTSIHAQWRGRAVRVNLAGSPVTAAQNATIRTNTASFGSIGGPVSSSAPTTTASVTGTITDATGAIIPNASITITNPTTKATSTVISGTNGHYRADNLIPGNYQLEATAPGFQKQQLALSVAASLQNQANITLTVGSVSEAVTVVAAEAMPLITTQSSLANSRAALKKAAPKAPAKPTPAPLFEITTDNGDHWTSPDGKTWVLR